MNGTGSWLGSTLRRHLWRIVVGTAGGLTITGPRPTGPGIVVANHTSHADTAIMFACLPARARPFAAAAADYWRTRWYKRWATDALVATVPVHRGDGDTYDDLLQAVRARVERGGLVIVYPEGTRTQDGAVGEFKSGAVRLARDLQVPLYPAAILGVGHILPKNGHFRRGHMQIIFGAGRTVPVNATREQVKTVATQLRDEVTRMKGNDEPASDRSGWFKL